MISLSGFIDKLLKTEGLTLPEEISTNPPVNHIENSQPKEIMV
jgi:hypothetical protein